MPLGVNLCCAVKRMPQPHEWARFVREDLGLDLVQFTFDLLDPWAPAQLRTRLARRITTAAADYGLTIDSAFVGLAHYVPSGLLDPDPDARAVALTWWRHAIDLAAELGARAVGGPLGTISDHDDADTRARAARRADLTDAVAELAQAAAAAGLDSFLVEPTPIAREYPATITDCHHLLQDLERREVTNVGLVLDTGHMLYQPLHGADARVDDWITELSPHIRGLHLDNADGHGDPHWGWPHPDGTVGVADLAHQLTQAGIGDIPVMLEVYPRFEDSSSAVRELLRSSVEHCRPHFTPASAREVSADAVVG
ncbi:sugar phosphate isomerase/epimerase [Lentzea atacamensis]|uniref:Sugar phosphate isomerase/epimerase n=1 Tax=Lentzea atacamensis TaxID=531938 RepID=A0ABX9DYB2_9PSEU|nr:sugar phosphate isomerase/epimerase [Lentzea atacamensis]RAS59419.1 sugar phosphate isomerase/epimerase [Lentzea atacamensis]